MGGFYLRDWILELYGVDLLHAAAMVACGLRPTLPAHPRARRGHLMGHHVPGVPALEGTEFHCIARDPAGSSRPGPAAQSAGGALVPGECEALLQCGLCWVQPGRGPSPPAGPLPGSGRDEPHYPRCLLLVPLQIALGPRGQGQSAGGRCGTLCSLELSCFSSCSRPILGWSTPRPQVFPEPRGLSTPKTSWI